MPTKISQLITCLRELGRGQFTPSTYHQTLAKSEKVLSLVFSIGTERLTFKEEDKKIIGPLMAKALEPIKRNILSTRINFQSWLGAGASRKRSALQFLIDDYGDFPVGSTTLAAIFEEVKINELTKLLDDIEKDWVPTDSDYDDSD